MASEDEEELERAIAEVRAGTVTEVILGGASIDDAGATQLADALRTNTSVKELDLTLNSIGVVLMGRIEALLAPAARAQRKADFAWRRRRTLLMCVVATRSLRVVAATAPPAESGGGSGGSAQDAPQAAQFELKPVPWAAFLARYAYRAAGQQADAGGAQAAGAGGADGKLSEFLAFGMPEDKLLCCVLAYL